MILVIDNYDSFTYNLVHYIGEFEKNIKVVRNDQLSVEQVLDMKPDKIVISPGPCTPSEAGISVELIQSSNVPILGVCLGHQCIGVQFNSKIQTAKQVTHGKTAAIFHDNKSIFQGLSNPFDAALYHSLAIDKVPECHWP